MNKMIGAFAALFGGISFGTAMFGQGIAAGIFGLCAGVLGFMAGRGGRDDD